MVKNLKCSVSNPKKMQASTVKEKVNILDRVVDSPVGCVFLKLGMIFSFVMMAKMSDTIFASAFLGVIAILCTVFFACEK